MCRVSPFISEKLLGCRLGACESIQARRDACKGKIMTTEDATPCSACLPDTYKVQSRLIYRHFADLISCPHHIIQEAYFPGKTAAESRSISTHRSLAVTIVRRPTPAPFISHAHLHRGGISWGPHSRPAGHQSSRPSEAPLPHTPCCGASGSPVTHASAAPGSARTPAPCHTPSVGAWAPEKPHLLRNVALYEAAIPCSLAHALPFMSALLSLVSTPPFKYRLCAAEQMCWQSDAVHGS